MLNIDIHYSFGEGPFVIGGEINDIPFEMKYFHGYAYLVVLTDDFVLRTSAGYGVYHTERLDNLEAGQLIYNLAKQLDNEF